MMLGIGDTTTTQTTPASPSAFSSFTTGLQQWTSPSQALATATTLLTNPSTSFSTPSTGAFTLGVLAVPIALIMLVANMGGGRR